MNTIVANIFRTELKRIFPTIKFSVRSKQGMGYTSIDITPKGVNVKPSAIYDSLNHLVSKSDDLGNFSEVYFNGNKLGTIYAYVN